MSVLASLTHAYDRMADRGEAPPFGYSSEKISFLISLKEDGTPAGAPADLRAATGKKLTPRLMAVPASFKRPGVTPRPFFLWDNTAFALGVTAQEDKDAITRFKAFQKRHIEALTDVTDAGLLALRRFVERWTPEEFDARGWPEAMKDQNVIFALESERLRNVYIHDRPAARMLWAQILSSDEGSKGICLVTGNHAPIERLHPAIKGVWGARSSGASLVSFNLDAFTSYGQEQGANAPVSEAAAFAYTAVLNKFLESGSRNRMQIGDASTVFWADASNAETAIVAEGAFAAMFGGTVDEGMQASRVAAVLEKIRNGQPLNEIAPELTKGVRFYVLGLAPNAARLSVRFWLDDDFGTIAANYQEFLDDMRIAPPPKDQHAGLWRYLNEVAVLGKRENIPPNLAGEWMRSILTGANYPLTLLSSTLMRLRSDKNVNAYRAAILKAVLVRNFKMKKEAPMALDLENRNKGYLLGRLFAVYEQVQSAALGRNVNATVKDKFYGAASAQPRKVFVLLDSGSANHLSKIGKQKPGYRITLEKLVAGIMEIMSPGDDPFPASLSAEQQALFALGYYHQRSEFFKSRNNDPAIAEETNP